MSERSHSDEGRTPAESADGDNTGLLGRSSAQRIARTAHDMRAPLHTLLGVTELLESTHLDATQRHYLTTLRDAAGAIRTLVDDLLLNRSGSAPLQAEPFSPKEALEHVAEMVALRAQAKGLSVACVVAADVPREVVGDRARLVRVLSNLASNAVKFSTAGDVVLRVRTATGAPGRASTEDDDPAQVDSAALVFQVEDAGPGISPADRERIFLPYVQVGAGAAQDGVGLGLAICAELVERMGGTIRVDSAEGKGSTFQVELTFAVRHGDARATPIPQELGGLRFLVLGASAGTLESVRSALSPWRPDLVACADCDELSEADWAFDVVFVDGVALPAELPNTSTSASHAATVQDLPSPAMAAAVRTVARVRVEAARRAFGVVALLNADELFAKAAVCERLGATVLAKPVRASQLYSALGRALQTRRHTLASRGHTVALPDLAGIHVLVVDDVATNLEYARLVLEAAHARVDVESDGRRVTQWLNDAPSLSLLLVDLEMPVLSGVDVIALVRTMERERRARDEAQDASSTRIARGDEFLPEAGGAGIPILVLSGHAEGRQVTDAFRAGANGLLAKPAGRNDLLAAVATYARRPARAAPAHARAATDAPTSAKASSNGSSPSAAEAFAGRLKEAQMALVRRDFRALAFAASALRQDAPDAAQRLAEAAGARDARRAQEALNHAARALPAAAIGDAETKPRRAREPAIVARTSAILTTGIRGEFKASAQEALERLEALRPWHTARSRDDARRIAHRLAGSAKTFGFGRVGDCAKATDDALSADGDAAGGAATAAVERLLEALRAALVDSGPAGIP